MGWPVIFMTKRGAPEFFLRFKGGRKFFAIFFLHQTPSQVFVKGPLTYANMLNGNAPCRCIWFRFRPCCSGVYSRGSGGRMPQTLLTGKFLVTYREKRGKETRKLRRKEVKSKKGRWKIENGSRKSYKMRRGPFSMLFTFQNHWNLFRVYQNGNFIPGKLISQATVILRKVISKLTIWHHFS